ncbi:MAG: hypothetical protein Q9225_005864 [Loekoesia sp. 1 TL-2023]
MGIARLLYMERVLMLTTGINGRTAEELQAQEFLIPETQHLLIITFQLKTNIHSMPTSQEQRSSAYYSQAPRPASGQSHRAGGPNVQTAQGVNQSPPLPANRAPTASSISNVPPGHAHTTIRPEQAGPQQRQYVDRRSSGSPAQVPNGRNNKQTPTPTATAPDTHKSHHFATDSASLQQTYTARPEARASVSSGEQVPTTVNPSHVFNHQEYQRRQAAAASEAAAKKAAEEERARKAVEAEENRKATEAAAALKRVSESQNGALRDTELSKEEQMAAEMRNMIEKMRDYKSKDPSLFSQIWEQVKKTQPAGSVPAAPPISAKDIPSTTGKPGRPSVLKGAFSPSTAPDVDGELPDLGRFPAQRRRRGGKTDSPARKRKSTGKPTDESSPQVNGTQSGPPIDPAIIEASNHSQQQTTPTPHQSSTTISADGISASQDKQDIYVKGVGPRVVRPVHSNDSSRPLNVSAELPAAISTGPNNRATDPMQAPVQAPNPAGRTNWPEHKKWDLAVAAKSILLAMPINSAKAKSISPEQILAYLNQNPSYEQLCQMIESKGLIIERGHFARCLLEAVPGMGPGVHQQRTALANKLPAINLNIQQPNGSGFGALTPPVNLKFINQNQKTISNKAPTAQMTPALSEPSSTQNLPMSEDKPKVPLTKQEMARKRNIVDIVDLSQLSDDDMPPPPKVPRLGEQAEHVQPPTPNKGVDSLHGYHRINTPPSINGPPANQPPTHYTPAYQPAYSYNPLPPPPNQPSVETSARQRELINSEDIVQPIDEHKAKKRKRYDPKTIVSDVLIAAGRHPTMEPLNYHLDNLRKTFKHVNDTSDLDTFRWDLVDPGEPPKIAIEPTQPHAAHDMGPGDEADGNEADDEDQDVTRNAPQSRTTLAASLPTAVSMSVEAPHVIAPPPKLLGPQRKRVVNQSNSVVDKSWMSSGLNSYMNHKSNESSLKTPQPASNGTGVIDSTGSTGIKRRGRPPGSKNKHPRKSTGTPSQSTNNMSSRPRIDTTPARPSGLRNSVASTDGIAIIVPSPSPSIADTQPRRRGRPKKSSPKTSQQSTLIHRIYKCHWENCPAELHNLETLKKHVNKHGEKFKDEGGPFPCLWKGCGKAARSQEGYDDDEEPERQPLRYGTQDMWAKHMDRRHVAEYAWKLGDGPSIRSDSDMSDYISDSARRQVTPIISNEGRPDPLPLTSSGKPEKVYHKAHGITTELAKAQAFMEASERRRQSFGPGMDRGGATFVTKRKNDLLDDSMGPLRKVQKEDYV